VRQIITTFTACDSIYAGIDRSIIDLIVRYQRRPYRLRQVATAVEL
jgi:hypothetical protein